MDVASIRSSADLHCIGDVIYLSDKSIAPARWGRIMKFLKTQKWFSEAAAPCGFIAGLPARHAGPMALDALMHNWSGGAGICSRWENRKEPEWLRLLPRDAQAHIRRDYAVIEGTEPLGIVPSIPFAGFGYIVQEEGRESLHSFTSDAFQVFKIHRLGRIRQLSFLHDPVLREADLANPAMTFDHTRLCHSFDVLAIAALIGKNCGLSEENQKIFQLAALTHDARTPAGGDSIKLIDPPAFDEEAHYHELLSGSEWDGFSAEYGIDGVKLDQAVRGEGTLGALLDIADKLAYVGRDALAFLGGDGRISPACHGAGYYTIADIVGHDPLVCGLWESVRLVGGRAVINDADRLERFLALRAFLFRELYYNPASRFFEYLLGRGVAKYLYQNGVISREELLSEGDEWIERKVEEFLGGHYVLRGIHFLGHTRLEEHSSQASAHRRAAEFDGDDSVFTIVDEFQHVANSAARKLFVRRKGEVVPFSEARPEAAENIDSLMTFRSVPRVYFFSADDLHISPETRARMKTVFRYLREHQ